MKYRIAIWAAAGFLVASGWAVYFLVASKDHPIEPIVSTLVRLTCPVVLVGAHYPVSLSSALVANVATYALVGLAVEPCGGNYGHGCNRRVTNQDDPCENAFESDGFLPVSIHARGTPAAREILLLPERAEARDRRHTSDIPALCHGVSFLSLVITHFSRASLHRS
jgi:hypothetical protein